MTAIVLRQASFPEDTASVSALLDSYLRQTETEKAEHALVSNAGPLPERYQREVADPAKRLHRMRVIVATADGLDCGVVVVGTSVSGASEIKRFWTDPTARGLGVGSALISEALRGIGRPVQLSVWDWREPAITLYRKLGFVISPTPWDDRERLLCLELS